MSDTPPPPSRHAPHAAGLSAALAHESGWPVLSITDSPQTIDLSFVNRTPHPVAAGPAVVQLVFRPGVLSDIERIALAPQSEAEWVLTIDTPEPGAEVTLTFTGVDRAVLAPGAARIIRLDGVSAAEEGGSRATRVQFIYEGFFHDNGVEVAGERLVHLPILRRHEPDRLPQRAVRTGSAARAGPFVAGFTGQPALINDGKTANHRVLRIVNTSGEPLRLASGDDAATRFHLGFEQGPWGLIRARGDRVLLRAGPESRGWRAARHTVFRDTPGAWMPGEVLDLLLDIHTSAHSGRARIIVTFENLPGHDDDDLVLILDLGAQAEVGDAVHLVRPLALTGARAEIALHAKEGGTGAAPVTLAANTADTARGRFDIGAPAGMRVTGPDQTALDLDSITNSNALGTPAARLSARGQGSTNLVLRAQSNDTPVDAVTISSGGMTVAGGIEDRHGPVVPVGTIVMWSGYRGREIPDGWALCDGGDGRPDLRGRFIVGHAPFGRANGDAPSTGNSDYSRIGRHGGEASVRLEPREMPAHRHEGTTDAAGTRNGAIQVGGLLPFLIPGATVHAGAVTGGSEVQIPDRHGHDFTTTWAGENYAHENRPPYYVLAFIMKIG